MLASDLLRTYQARIETVLDARLPSAGTEPQRLHEAMRYSTLDGGKRVRPVLVYATGGALGTPLEALDAPATAVELIHVYSLVHDDLPAMDDDDLRRGRPTCHKAYDEATAILAGDALQALAFEILGTDTAIAVGAEQRLAMLAELARASGVAGMVGGQALDIDATGRQLELEQLQRMHRMKTGALIRAAVRLGALAAPACNAEQLAELDRYAAAIGLAFQVQDDILDVVADTATLGKPQGSDSAHDKATYVQLLGLDGARAKSRALHQEAHDALSGFDDQAELLRWLADYIVERSY